jgi:hypothetical protein
LKKFENIESPDPKILGIKLKKLLNMLVKRSMVTPPPEVTGPED